jgi:hypothetical protein
MILSPEQRDPGKDAMCLLDMLWQTIQQATDRELENSPTLQDLHVLLEEWAEEREA